MWLETKWLGEKNGEEVGEREREEKNELYWENEKPCKCDRLVMSETVSDWKWLWAINNTENEHEHWTMNIGLKYEPL